MSLSKSKVIVFLPLVVSIVAISWACKVRLSVGEVKAIAETTPGKLRAKCFSSTGLTSESNLVISENAKEVYPLPVGTPKDGERVNTFYSCVAWKE